MLSVARNWSAVVSARCSYDFQESRSATTQFASTGLFLAALGIRPVVDALRTTAIQTEPACGPPKGSGVSDLERNLVMATLTTGPVGIGDMIGGTNLTLLNRALRSDGVILKPGFAAHRLDNFYMDTANTNTNTSTSTSTSTCRKAEVWSAPTVPARTNSSARHDRRANSMARLFPLTGSGRVRNRSASTRDLWWYSLLLWDLSESNCSITPAQLSPPALSSHGYVVSRFGKPCKDGAAAASCVKAFIEETSPLDVATTTSQTGRATDIRLHQVAPVLPGGWVLLGEQSKYVAVSPQRFMSARVSGSSAAAAAAAAVDDASGGARDALSDALSDDELLYNGGMGDDNLVLGFTVLGEPGETVDVAVICPSPVSTGTPPISTGTPPVSTGTPEVTVQDQSGIEVKQRGVVTVLQVVVGAAGQSKVECAPGKPKVCQQVAVHNVVE